MNRVDPVTADELPAGQLEYWCRVSIRDLVRLYGFENARELIAIYLNDEADRSPTNGNR
jgi:hypothetical protein